ncbi:MAG: DUF1178 family protein [Pseudomonadota bacterium]
MIKYQLQCDADHEFEGWFRDSADYDAQAEDGLISCPTCGGDKVRKAVMSPAVARSRPSGERRLSQISKEMAEAAGRARAYVEKNFDYVGKDFSEEARKIHYGETEHRQIYGEASGKEVKDLVEEGVPVAPVPGPQPKTDKAGPAKLPATDKKLN